MTDNSEPNETVRPTGAVEIAGSERVGDSSVLSRLVVFFGFDLVAAFLPLLVAIFAAYILQNGAFVRYISSGELGYVSAFLAIYTLERIVESTSVIRRRTVALVAVSVYYLVLSVLVIAYRDLAHDGARLATVSALLAFSTLVCSILILLDIKESSPPPDKAPVGTAFVVPGIRE